MMQHNSTRTRVKPWGDESRDAEIRANRLLRNLLRLIRSQIEAGGFFSLEQPAPSIMLDAPEILDILNIKGTYIGEFDQCMIGLLPPKGHDNKQDVRGMKPTRLVTNVLNFANIARNTTKQCS